MTVVRHCEGKIVSLFYLMSITMVFMGLESVVMLVMSFERGRRLFNDLQ